MPSIYTRALRAGVAGAGDPQLTTPGIGRADVWVFDANNTGAPLGGVPLKIVTLFGDTTFTCVPPGSGRRIGIDRDLDGILNGDDILTRSAR